MATSVAAPAEGDNAVPVSFNDSFTFSRSALERKLSINYSRGDDVLLHVIVREDSTDLVANDRRDGKWGREVSVPLSRAEIDDVVRVRVWVEESALFLQIGSREMIPMPRFAGLLETDHLKAPSGVYHRRSYPRPAGGERIAGLELPADPATEPLLPLGPEIEAVAAAPILPTPTPLLQPVSVQPGANYLPRGVRPGGPRIGGATDYFDRTAIRGWVYDGDRPRYPTGVRAMCQGRELATSWALLPRADLAVDGGAAPNAGYAIAWQRFDLTQLEEVAAAAPQATIEIEALLADGPRPLHNVFQPIPASTALEFVRAARATPSPTTGLLHSYEIIAGSGAFDGEWYRYRYLGDHPQDSLLHYLEVGEEQARRPNFYFDPESPIGAFRKSADESLFVEYCERRLGTEGLPPHFDEPWYVATYRPTNVLPLADYLANRHTRNPNRHFDVAYYLASNPDVVGVPDPYEHFVCFGVFEGRRPSEHLAFSEESRANPDAHNPFLVHIERSDTHAPAPIAADPLAFEARLRDSALFDYGHYATQQAQALPEGLDALIHFVEKGDQELLAPNALFDPTWYLKTYFKRPPAQNPFLHYITIGERSGLHPSPLFDPEWYARTYDVPQEGALEHYLGNRASNRFAPNEYFDPAYYLDTQPDIRAANIEAFGHWYSWGIFESRRGSPRFDANYVWRRYLNNNRSVNAFAYFMDMGRRIGWQPMPAETDHSVHRDVKRNCSAGPLFEELALPDAFAPAPLVKTFAFYLPQFHAIPENDEWWGTGFTEWRNVPRGMPRFAGHYQPRVPRDLGFYELEGSDQLRRHAALAQSMGITGFSFYYYNFNGHRLLEKPLDAFCDDDTIDMPFSIIWANENWTRRWDGMERDVLMRQDYREEDLPALVDDLARYLTHPRYHCIGGRPILPIYRADVIPDCAKVLERMRAEFVDRYGVDPIFTMAQAFGALDPRDYGFDGAFEFPPHKVGAALPLLNDQIDVFDVEFDGQVRGYDAVVETSLSDLPDEYPLIKTAFPSWDNDARKQGSGLIFSGSTPQKFQNWLSGLAGIARQNPFFGEPVVFVNAWNEWCEGAYLEPDCHFGFAYLNALSRAIRPQPLAKEGKAEKILLVGHDAFPAGAQEHLIHWGRVFKRDFGTDIRFLLLSGGALVPRYREIAETVVLDEAADQGRELQTYLTGLREAGFDKAIVNTSVAGRVGANLARAGFDFVALVHELPTIIRDYHLQDAYSAVCDNARAVVFPNTFVGDAVQGAFGKPKQQAVIQPQGLYKQITPIPDARAQLLAEFDLPEDAKIVLNIGYLDLRKGVDLFVGTAAAFAADDPQVHFFWVGARDEKVWRWISHDVAKRGLTNIHFVEYTPTVDRFLQGCDAFFISSREDPFPSVVMEALACGKPVIAFENSGGHAALVTPPELGEAVDYVSVEAAAAAIRRQLAPERNTPALQQHRRDFIREHYDFPSYVATVAKLLEPSRPRVSVIVPSYNYAHYMEPRLSSVFNQTAPVFEVIVLDDASSDGAADTAREVARARDRDAVVIENEANSGNVFRQWKKGLDLARGDYVWIAEADDVAKPRFLEKMIAALNADPDALFAFTDSHAIDADGALMYESYKGYYSALGDTGLETDATYPAKEFLRRFLGTRNLVLNASAVVWRTDKLRAAFDALGDEAFGFTVAGDWRVYIEGCRLGGTIAYVADPLNGHRRHDNSVTHALKKTTHLNEIKKIHALLLKIFKGDKTLKKELGQQVTDLRKIWEM